MLVEGRLHQHISMTLGTDDLDIARYWLAHRDAWNDITLVRAYEREFAKWNGSRFAFAFQAGRKALSACVIALELKPGDEVIVPAFTCVVVANAFRYQEVKPVFCDIELETYGPDIDSVRKHLNSKTKAIVIQHSFGLVCRDYDAIIDLAQKHDLRIIEDAAHSTGAVFCGSKVGTRGDVGFYSSEHSKIFNTIVGGMAVTNDIEIAHRLNECGRSWDLPNAALIETQLLNVELDYYRFKHLWSPILYPLAKKRNGGTHIQSTTEAEIRGEKPAEYFTRMPPPIAALGLNQLAKIDRYNAIRRSTAKRWDAWCWERGYKSPTVVHGSEPVYLRYPVRVDERMKLDTSWAKEQLGVELGVWFTANLHPSLMLDGYPRADLAVRQCVNFPTILYDK
jgi:dTDP-4-amino-4,6-dideoxygalactose transaminase